jgi:3-oxoacyl-[acyl-carrier-protein] synthase II
MERRRVVITGLGCITALGESVEQLFVDLCAGKSAVSTIESFDTSAYPVHFAGAEVGVELFRGLAQGCNAAQTCDYHPSSFHH